MLYSTTADTEYLEHLERLRQIEEAGIDIRGSDELPDSFQLLRANGETLGLTEDELKALFL